jgi:hypothetical protein
MMSLKHHAFGFYRGLIASLISMGLLISILVVNGLGQECTLGSGPLDERCMQLGVQEGKWIAALNGVKEGELVMITPKAAKPGNEVRAEVMPATFLEG